MGYALDSPSGRTGAEPLPYVLAELLTHQGHPVHAEGAKGRRGIKEPGDDLHIGGVVGGVDRVGWSPPVWKMSGRTMAEATNYAPRPKCRCRRAFARSDCPVRSMHPHPVSLVHPFSPPKGQFHRFVGGLLGIPLGLSVTSASSAARVVSLMGKNCDRYVSHIRDVKSE